MQPASQATLSPDVIISTVKNLMRYRNQIFAAFVLTLLKSQITAQVVPTGFGVVEGPARVHYVFSAAGLDPSKAAFYYINYNTGEADTILANVSNSGSFTGTSTDTQRQVTGQINATTISLTYNGAALAMPKQSVYGPTSRFAGYYTGSLSDSGGLSFLTFLISSQGQILGFTGQAFQSDLGIGSLDSSGHAFVPLLSGRTASGTLNPKYGIAEGSLSLSTGDTATYSAVKAVPPRLANISTRGLVGQGEQILIGGFIVDDGGKTVVITAKGPSLSAVGVTNSVQNPRLELFEGDTLIASNRDWQSNANAAEITASGIAPTDSREAALQVALAQGAYTVKVFTEDSSTGLGLVEVYGVGTPTGR